MMTPGPTDLPPSVLAAGAAALLHHRTPEFRAVLRDALSRLREIARTANDVLVIPGSGTAGMEAAVSNLLSPGDTALVAACGIFGQRWAEICRAYGVRVVHEDAPFGETIDPQAVSDALRAHPEVRAVFVTLSETSTGVDCDVRAIAGIVRRTDAVLVVDAVSALAAAPLETDLWDVDVVVGASQKGLMTAPGLSFVALSARAWAQSERATSPRYYLDLRRFRERLSADPLPDVPWTPPISLVFQLAEATRLILAEGLAACWQRHESLAAACRAGIAAMGIELLAAEAHSRVGTALRVPPGVEAAAWLSRLRERFGASFAAGQGPLKGQIIRFGHVGYVDSLDIVTGLAALEMSLGEMGHAVRPGAAVAAAEELLRERSPVLA